MLVVALSTSPQAVLAVVAGWIALTALAWVAAVSAYERLSESSARDVDPGCSILLAVGISLTLAALVCVRAGTLQTGAEIFGAWACTAPLLQLWLDARVLPKPRRRQALPPMDDAIGGSRGY